MAKSVSVTVTILLNDKSIMAGTYWLGTQR
jgi:hypothetical protein